MRDCESASRAPASTAIRLRARSAKATTTAADNKAPARRHRPTTARAVRPARARPWRRPIPRPQRPRATATADWPKRAHARPTAECKQGTAATATPAWQARSAARHLRRAQKPILEMQGAHMLATPTAHCTHTHGAQHQAQLGRHPTATRHGQKPPPRRLARLGKPIPFGRLSWRMVWRCFYPIVALGCGDRHRPQGPHGRSSNRQFATPELAHSADCDARVARAACVAHAVGADRRMGAGLGRGGAAVVAWAGNTSPRPGADPNRSPDPGCGRAQEGAMAGTDRQHPYQPRWQSRHHRPLRRSPTRRSAAPRAAVRVQLQRTADFSPTQPHRPGAALVAGRPAACRRKAWWWQPPMFPVMPTGAAWRSARCQKLLPTSVQ